MKYVLYGHGTAYNHGAEAIVKTTVDVIRNHDKDAYIILSTHFADHDIEFGIDKIVDELIEYDKSWIEEEKKVLSNDKEYYASKMYEQILSKIDSKTICLGIGGDNYCYPNWHRQAIFHKKAKQKGAKSILWRCSINSDALDAKLVSILKEHDLIIVRESKTLHELSQRGITNTALLPDTAFDLPIKEVDLPTTFNSKSEVIGINVSPLILRYSNQENGLINSFTDLINYILINTNCNICLIPHVTLPVDNDIEALSKIYESVSFNDRVSIIDKNMCASEYKYIISNCELMICARTHASVAAYSTCVPTLVIGYSIKSIGIANDLECAVFVMDAKDVDSESLIKKFEHLYAHKNEIRINLKSLMKEYKVKAKQYCK